MNNRPRPTANGESGGGEQINSTDFIVHSVQRIRNDLAARANTLATHAQDRRTRRTAFSAHAATDALTHGLTLATALESERAS
jgi:hypothetical protein